LVLIIPLDHVGYLCGASAVSGVLDGGHATRVIVILAGCAQARKTLETWTEKGGRGRQDEEDQEEEEDQQQAKQQRHFTARAVLQELKQSHKQHSAART